MYEARFDEVLAFHEPGLAPVRRGGEAFHVDLRGKPAYARRFVRTFGFYEGRAAVVGPEGFHHILPDGTDLQPERFAFCGNYQQGRCVFRDKDGRYGHLDLAGRPVYDARYRYAGDYREGSAVVQMDSGLSTHVDERGALVHGRFYRDLDVFHKGFCRAQDDDGWVHADRRGLPVYARRFAAIEPFYNGQSRVLRFDGGLEIIDETGRTLLELRPGREDHDFAALSADLALRGKEDDLASLDPRRRARVNRGFPRRPFSTAPSPCIMRASPAHVPAGSGETESMKLCGFRISNYHNKVRLVLLEKEIPHEEDPTCFPSQSPEFLARSPMGKAPFLETDQGLLCESAVICEYLEDAFPQNPLLPKDAFARAKVREILQVLELHVELSNRKTFGALFFGGSLTDDAKQQIKAEVQKGLRAFAHLAQWKPYLAGDTYTLADAAAAVHLPMIAMTTQMAFGENLLTSIPEAAAYIEMLGKRPQVAKVWADRDEAFKAFMKRA